MTEESQQASSPAPKSKGMGCGTIIAILIIAFVLLGVGFNEAAGYYFANCSDEDVFECFFRRGEEPEPQGVAAKGTYTYKDYSAEITLNIPLEGGTVVGEVSGTCTGTAKGSYDGKDNGVLSGTLTGYCDPFFVKIPAKGSFSGTIQKEGKTVPLNVEGSGAGFEKADVMTLTF